MVMLMSFPTDGELAALDRCFTRAFGCSGGESRVRRLLFAWHNAEELGGFDLTDLWSLDESWRSDALTVIKMIARSPQGWYADRYGYGEQMESLVKTFATKG